MRQWIAAGLVVVVLTMWVANADAAYKGRVVDAETKEPIEGVVVIMEWDYLQFNIMPHAFVFAGAVETLTDKEGRFSLSRWWSFNPWKTLTSRNHLTIFKSGYEPITGGAWDYLLEEEWHMPKGTIVLKVEDGEPVLLLKKFSDIEHRRESLGSVTHRPTKNNLLLKEINKERQFFGLEPIPIR